MIRIIPRLDIKGPNLVKGVRLEGLRVLGKPELFARAYYEAGADELLYVDIVASLYGRNSLTDIVRRTADEVFIPLAVGGGLRTLDDIREVLRAGADKVTINTAAVRRPEFIREASRRFGSSTIVVSIEVIKRGDSYEAYTDNGRERTGLDAVEWASRAAELGAGEILVTSVDREGTGTGMDLELVRRVVDAVGVPVIACGGVGQRSDIFDAIAAGPSAIAAASVFHYGVLQVGGAGGGSFAAEINLAHLQRPGFGRIREVDLAELKRDLRDRGVQCRDVDVAA